MTSSQYVCACMIITQFLKVPEGIHQMTSHRPKASHLVKSEKFEHIHILTAVHHIERLWCNMIHTAGGSNKCQFSIPIWKTYLYLDCVSVWTMVELDIEDRNTWIMYRTGQSKYLLLLGMWQWHGEPLWKFVFVVETHQSVVSVLKPKRKSWGFWAGVTEERSHRTRNFRKIC